MNFITPLGLALGALTIPLLAMYFLKIRRRRVQVPSLLLWEQFAKNEQLASPFQKFRRHILLLLQLILLLLTVLAFARPYLKGQFQGGRAVVLVVDTSASMGATDESPNRLSAAKIRAISAVDNLAPGDEALIIEAGPQTGVVASFSRDIPQIRDAINAMVVREAEGSLRDGIQLALSLVSSRPNVEVLVFSDGGQEVIGDLNVGNTPLFMQNVGIESDNVGIVAMDIRSSPASDLDRQLFVTTQNFGPKPSKAALQVYLNDKLVAHRDIELAPGQPEPLVFQLPVDQKGRLRAQIKADNDYLPVDDVAYAVLEPVKKRKLLVVDGDGLTLRALGADPRFDVTISKSANVKPEHLAKFDAVFFMKRVPIDPTGVNYAVFRPTPGAAASFGATQKRPAITQWRRTHPTQRFVQWDGVLIGQAKKVTKPGGLAPIVDGDGGPLALAGTVQSGRVFQLAFDPWQSDLPLRVAWPVLVLNTAGWLTGGDASGMGSAAVKTGQPIIRRVDQKATAEEFVVKGPDGEVAIEVGDRLLRVQETTQVGFYEIRGGGTLDRVAANLSSVVESNIQPRRDVVMDGGETETQTAGVVGRFEVWRWLLLLGLAFLAIEWWVWHRRRVI